MSKTILNILNLPGESVKADILEDGIWQKAIIKDFNTSSAFWNRASIISISKAYVKEAPAALIYLLQKETKSLFLWEEKWGPVTPALNDFIVSLSTWGRFSKNTGETMSIEAFWNCYSYTIEGLISEPTFEFKVDQIVQPIR